MIVDWRYLQSVLKLFLHYILLKYGEEKNLFVVIKAYKS